MYRTNRRRDFIHPPIAPEFLNFDRAATKRSDNLAMCCDNLGYWMRARSLSFSARESNHAQPPRA